MSSRQGNSPDKVNISIGGANADSTTAGKDGLSAAPMELQGRILRRNHWIRSVHYHSI
jgi:hypothetical protein